MKKLVSLLLSCVFLFGAFSTVSYAESDSAYEVMPRLNNTAITNTGFMIDDNGIATIKVSYVGYTPLHNHYIIEGASFQDFS